MAIIKKSITITDTTVTIANVDKDVEKGNLCALSVGMYIDVINVENSMSFPRRTKNRTTI